MSASESDVSSPEIVAERLRFLDPEFEATHSRIDVLETICQANTGSIEDLRRAILRNQRSHEDRGEQKHILIFLEAASRLLGPFSFYREILDSRGRANAGILFHGERVPSGKICVRLLPLIPLYLSVFFSKKLAWQPPVRGQTEAGVANKLNEGRRRPSRGRRG